MTLKSDSYQEIADMQISLVCPHCNHATSLTPTSFPNYYALMRHQPNMIGIVFKCNSCSEPVFLKFRIREYNTQYNYIDIIPEYYTVENSKESFDYDSLAEPVKGDFEEALQCYSAGAFNAFAAMCRRTIQSAAASLGAKGKDKVQQQLNDLKEMTEIDEDTFAVLKQIILDGHDGAHPHLPSLSADRAVVLLDLMKDVMYQLFVRKAKLTQSIKLREQQIKK